MRGLKLLIVGVLVSTPYTALAADGTWDCWSKLKDGTRSDHTRVIVSNGNVLQIILGEKKIPSMVTDFGDQVGWVYDGNPAVEWTLDIKSSKLFTASSDISGVTERGCKRK
jgi:hypothetical protein